MTLSVFAVTVLSPSPIVRQAWANKRAAGAMQWGLAGVSAGAEQPGSSTADTHPHSSRSSSSNNRLIDNQLARHTLLIHVHDLNTHPHTCLIPASAPVSCSPLTRLLLPLVSPSVYLLPKGGRQLPAVEQQLDSKEGRETETK